MPISYVKSPPVPVNVCRATSLENALSRPQSVFRNLSSATGMASSTRISRFSC